MALVVLLKGLNVGGHRTLRPSVLAKDLARHGAVNIGAAGTFVIRKPVSRARLRAEIASRLPFAADVMICEGRDVRELIALNPFAGQPTGPDIIHFVSLMARRGKRPGRVDIPGSGRWGVRVLGSWKRFVYGLYRREMRAIGYLGQLDTLCGASVTTRSWSTILSVARALDRKR